MSICSYNHISFVCNDLLSTNKVGVFKIGVFRMKITKATFDCVLIFLRHCRSKHIKVTGAEAGSSFTHYEIYTSAKLEYNSLVIG